MDYFVSITSNFYYYWQIELLIESFKRHNIQDNLLIAIDTTMGIVDECLPNLATHGRKFAFKNDQSQHANKLFAGNLAIANNLLSWPFAWIHPDMVLLEPLKNEIENIVYHPTEDDPQLRTIVNYPQDSPLVTVDGVVVFKDMPQVFFRKAYAYLLEGEKNKLEGRLLGKYAWTKAIYDYWRLVDIQPRQMEIELAHHEYIAPFIHYRRGLPPHFSKQNYKNQFLALDADPFEVLVQHNPTTTSNYLRDIVLSYRNH